MRSGRSRVQKQEILHPDVPPGLLDSFGKIPAVHAIILYGSAARGKKTPFSDTDLCIVTGPGLTGEEWETIMSHTGPALDIVIFRDLPPSIRFRVIREGKILLNRDPVFLHRTYAETIREFLDLQPLIERNSRRVLGRMAGPA